jgi:hypothetical protein
MTSEKTDGGEIANQKEEIGFPDDKPKPKTNKLQKGNTMMKTTMRGTMKKTFRANMPSNPNRSNSFHRPSSVANNLGQAQSQTPT